MSDLLGALQALRLSDLPASSAAPRLVGEMPRPAEDPQPVPSVLRPRLPGLADIAAEAMLMVDPRPGRRGQRTNRQCRQQDQDYPHVFAPRRSTDFPILPQADQQVADCPPTCLTIAIRHADTHS